MKFLEILTTIMGMVMSLGYFFQSYSIFKNKSSKNVSIVSYMIFGLGTLTWAIYGLATMNWVVIFGFGLGVIGSWLTIYFYFKYKNK